MVRIQIATTDQDIRACYPVMKELRPHLDQAQFLAQVRRQQMQGYRLAWLEEGAGPVAVAGFRTGESLAWGPFLYVDDLVTRPEFRSRGHGARLLSWLKAYARKEGGRQLHLDSGIDREAAHRFYEREGMMRAGFHFVCNVD